MSSTSSKLLLRETIARRMWQSVTLHELDKERSFVFILSTSFMKMSELVLGLILLIRYLSTHISLEIENVER